jgi:hypothetical protein
MFIHTAHFTVQQNQVKKYRADSCMWARCAKKSKGFIAYYTFKSSDYRNRYISAYIWKTKKDNDRFMSKFHDYLVSKSNATVFVNRYCNMTAIDTILGN